jgi:hypothetical protein
VKRIKFRQAMSIMLIIDKTMADSRRVRCQDK